MTEQPNFKYSLLEADSYMTDICCNSVQVLKHQISLTHEYTNRMNELYIATNNKHHFYIFIRGLETLYHIYQYLLFYTQNVHLAHNYCQKSIYFYIEYINQIMDDPNVFLKLTITDAILFVYKKTIYNINPKLSKAHLPDNIYNILHIHGNTTKMVISNIYYMNNHEVNPFDHIYEFFNTISIHDLIPNDLNDTEYSAIYTFIKLLNERFHNTIIQSQYIDCIHKMSKKIHSKNLTEKDIIEKMNTKNISSLNPTQIIKLFD